MKKTALTLLAIAGLCCSNGEKNPVPPARVIEIVEIPANECREVCGGKICYEDIKLRANSGKIAAYTIAAEGFENYTSLDGRMIFAGKCVFYKLSNDIGAISLEKLR
ncbi:MAG: hypothetical protein V1734_06360 [Nanoarchaeota archaeon]